MNQNTSENNKRIAKNTIALYVRMIILLFVNLYSSRIVLQELGAEDFGIYNIVGGIVALFSFLNATMSGATSRFLTYALGEKDYSKLKETFKASLTLHILIAVLILIISESIGLWFVNEKLIIPQDKIDVANIVYQLSIFTVIIKTIQVPFNASIISHEKMGVYAGIEIVNALIIVAFLNILQIINSGKLIIYASMVLSVAICVLILYTIFCLKHFSECTLKLSRNKEIMKPMLSFSGFDLYGNMCVSARTQGINVILNLFFGTVINAANGIATQVQAAILMLSTNVTSAFRPQIIKNVASNDIELMEKQLNYSSIISVLLFSIFSIPLVIEMPYVLRLWLGEPPMYVESITRISVFACWVGSINGILNIPIHATGKIKALSICGGTIYLLTLPAVYICLYYWKIPELAYCVMFVFMLILLIATCILLKKRLPQFSMKNYWIKSLFPCFIAISIAGIFALSIHEYMRESFLRLITIGISYAVILLIIIYSFILSDEDREKIRFYLKIKGQK